MDTISIGMMLPTSSIRPMSKDFERAFKESINKILAGSNYEVEIIPEMIGNGSHAQIEGVLDKFFGYHDVDLVTGIVSSHGIQHLVDRFEKRKVPLVYCNLGEHFLPSKGYNDYVFQNSIHLWQQVWLLGYYAAEHLGGKGMILSSMYDSGYCFMSAFELGMRAANPDIEHELKLLPLPQAGELSAIKEGLDVIDMTSCDFLFPIFCGEEATIFLDEFKKRDLAGKVELVGLPFLMELGDSDLSGISIYTTNDIKGGADLVYKHVFRVLGNSTGTAVGEAILSSDGKISNEAMNEALTQNNGTKVYASTASPRLTSPVSIQKVTLGKDDTLSFQWVMEQVVDLEENEEFRQIRDTLLSAWVNPYLGI